MRDTALARYYRILEGEENAKFLSAKAKMLSVDLGDLAAKLKEVHQTALLNKRSWDRTGGVSLLDLKIELARRMLRDCQLCERRCRVDRTAGETGFCGVADARISSEFIHKGEEPDLVPSYTVFFSGCTLRCVFCQNWDISTRPERGESADPADLAGRIEQMASGLSGKIRNVNWVGGDPTSNLPFILETLRECNASVPQVWNSNMYLSEEAMALLNGVVDLYLTDFKYGNDKCANRLSDAPDYFTIVARNHLMAREQAEMIIRHLVLPGHLNCCTMPVMKWIADNLDDVKVNVMAQYRPEYRAREFDEISRPLRMKEYSLAIEAAESLGLDLCD